MSLVSLPSNPPLQRTSRTLPFLRRGGPLFAGRR